MEQNKHRPAGSLRRERNWQRFTATGRVEDYLRYATEDAEFSDELTPETAPSEDNTFSEESGRDE